MIALDLFRIPAFAMAGATSFATFTAQGLAYVGLPFFFQEALGRTPLESGLLLTSWPLAIAVVAPIAGRLSDRFPGRDPGDDRARRADRRTRPVRARWRTTRARSEIVLHGVVCGLGFGFFQSPNNRELIGSAPREKSASAGGLLAAIRVGGQTLGTAMVAIVFGVLGGSLVAGAHAHDLVTRAAPVVLWVATAWSGIATLASALRLRGGVAAPRGA